MRMIAAILVLLAGSSLQAQTSAPAKNLSPAQKLAQPVEQVSFSGTPLQAVLEQYARQYHVGFAIQWSALRELGITPATPVSVKADKLTLAKLLDVTLNGISPKTQPLAWYFENNEVIISTQMRVLLRNQIRSLPFGVALASPVAARAASPAAAQTAGQTGVARASSEGLEYSFADTPLSSAIDFFRDSSQLNFFVNWRSLEQAGIMRETPVSLKVRNVTIAKALDLTLEQLNAGKDKYSSVYWIVDDGVVQVATGSAINTATKAKVFEVGDLLATVPNFTAPQMDLSANSNNSSGTNGAGGTSSGNSSSSGGLFNNSSGGTSGTSGAGAGNTDPTAQRQQVRDTLIALIKDSIGQDMWVPTGKGDVRIMGTRLIVSQTPLGFKLLEQSFR